MVNRVRRRVASALATVKRIVYTTVAIAMAIVFAVVAIFALSEAVPPAVDNAQQVLDVIGEGCETELCCDDCRVIPVSRVIDGDTFVSGGSRVRLFGVDTPEVGESCATEATERLRGLAGDTVRVEPGPRSQDSFGRSLFYTYTEAGDSIDEILVSEGLAYAWTRDGQHRDYIASVERSARTQGTGCLW